MFMTGPEAQPRSRHWLTSSYL